MNVIIEIDGVGHRYIEGPEPICPCSSCSLDAFCHSMAGMCTLCNSLDIRNDVKSGHFIKEEQ